MALIARLSCTQKIAGCEWKVGKYLADLLQAVRAGEEGVPDVGSDCCQEINGAHCQVVLHPKDIGLSIKGGERICPADKLRGPAARGEGAADNPSDFHEGLDA